MPFEPDFDSGILDLTVEKPNDFGFNRRADWDVKFGGSISAGITFHDGRLFFGCADHHLYCMNAKTGGKVWRFKANDVNDTSYPIIDDGIVYSGFFDGYLYAVNEKNGNLIWKFKTGDRVTGTPTVCNNLVVFGSWDGYIYALDKTCGKEIWRFKVGERVGCTPTFHNNKIIIGAFDGYVYCLDTEGNNLWRTKTGGSMFNYHEQPINNGIIYFTNWDGNLYALNTGDGSEAWRFRMGKGTGVTPLLHENKLYFGSWDNYFYCIDIHGNELWRFKAKDILEDFKPLIVRNMIYFGSIDGNFYALNKMDGKLVWAFKTEDTIWSTAISYENMVIFGGWDCYVYALDNKTGKLIWKSMTSTKNKAKHIVEVKYSYGGKVNATLKNDDEKSEAREINVNMDNSLYSSENQYITKNEYAGGHVYGT